MWLGSCAKREWFQSLHLQTGGVHLISKMCTTQSLRWSLRRDLGPRLSSPSGLFYVLHTTILNIQKKVGLHFVLQKSVYLPLLSEVWDAAAQGTAPLREANSSAIRGQSTSVQQPTATSNDWVEKFHRFHRGVRCNPLIDGSSLGGAARISQYLSSVTFTSAWSERCRPADSRGKKTPLIFQSILFLRIKM